MNEGAAHRIQTYAVFVSDEAECDREVLRHARDRRVIRLLANCEYCCLAVSLSRTQKAQRDGRTGHDHVRGLGHDCKTACREAERRRGGTAGIRVSPHTSQSPFGQNVRTRYSCCDN